MRRRTRAVAASAACTQLPVCLHPSFADRESEDRVTWLRKSLVQGARRGCGHSVWARRRWERGKAQARGEYSATGFKRVEGIKLHRHEEAGRTVLGRCRAVSVTAPSCRSIARASARRRRRRRAAVGLALPPLKLTCSGLWPTVLRYADIANHCTDPRSNRIRGRSGSASMQRESGHR